MALASSVVIRMLAHARTAISELSLVTARLVPCGSESMQDEVERSRARAANNPGVHCSCLLRISCPWLRPSDKDKLCCALTLAAWLEESLSRRLHDGWRLGTKSMLSDAASFTAARLNQAAASDWSSLGTRRPPCMSLTRMGSCVFPSPHFPSIVHTTLVSYHAGQHLIGGTPSRSASSALPPLSLERFSSDTAIHFATLALALWGAGADNASSVDMS